MIEEFGIKSFNKKKMKESLPYPIYLKWKDALRNEKDFQDDPAKLREKTLELVRDVMEKHDRVICDGDNYSDDWKEEAKRRGLANHKTYFDALVALRDFDFNDIFIKRGIYTEKEIKASYEVNLEEVVIYHSLEAKTMVSMINKDLIPMGMAELKDLSQILKFKNNEKLRTKYDKIDKMITDLLECGDEIELLLDHSNKIDEIYKKAEYVERNIATKLLATRKIADQMEKLISRKNMTLPSYEDIFNSLS